MMLFKSLKSLGTKNGSASLRCEHIRIFHTARCTGTDSVQEETMRTHCIYYGGSKPEFGDVDKNKFEPQKSDAKSGSLKVNGLETDDSAIYFCAVSNTVCQRLESAVQKHSVHKKTITALVNRWQSGTTNVPRQNN